MFVDVEEAEFLGVDVATATANTFAPVGAKVVESPTPREEGPCRPGQPAYFRGGECRLLFGGCCSHE